MSGEGTAHESTRPVQTNLTRGVLFALTGGVFLSTGGLALRFVESASGWQILAYRAGAFVVFMGAFLLFRYRRDALGAVRNTGLLGVIVALSLGLGSVCYVFAMLNTTVANVVVILSASPLLTAALAWLVLRERLDLFALGAMLAASAGIAVMFADGVAAGGLAGMVIALVAVLCFAVMLVALRVASARDMMPAIGMSGVVTLVIAYAMSEGELGAWDAGVSVYLGVFQFGLGFVCLTLATRYIQAALVALLSLAEVVLAPVWVWLGVGEIPTTLTFVGGAFVLSAVMAQGMRALSQG